MLQSLSLRPCPWSLPVAHPLELGMRLDCQGFRTFPVTWSPPGLTDVKVLSPRREGSHGSIGCAENPDTVLFFLHDFSFVGICTLYSPTHYLWDVGCTMGFDCAPRRVAWRLKEGTPCAIWQVCTECWAGPLYLHNHALGFLFL